MALSFYSWCISGVQHHGCWWDQTRLTYFKYLPSFAVYGFQLSLGHLPDAVSQEEVRGNAVFDSVYMCLTPQRRRFSAVTLPEITREVPLWRTQLETSARYKFEYPLLQSDVHIWCKLYLKITLLMFLINNVSAACQWKLHLLPPELAPLVRKWRHKRPFWPG